jgi:tetratricopeptide (TPR) repeat protein
MPINGNRRIQDLLTKSLQYANEGRWDEALSGFRRCIEMSRMEGDKMNEGQSLFLTGDVFKAQGRWQEAIPNYKLGLTTCREYADIVPHLPEYQSVYDYSSRMGELEGIIENLLSGLGECYAAQQNWGEAINCYQQSLRICRKYDDKLTEGRTLVRMGLIYVANGDILKARELAVVAACVLDITEDRESEILLAKLQMTIRRSGC